MIPTRVLQGFFCLVLMSVFTLGVNGCKSDDPTSPGGGGTTVMSSSNASPTLAVGASVQVSIRGGRKPYTIELQPDTGLVTASLGSDSVLTILAKSSGVATVRVKDADTNRVTITVSVTGAITYDLFPLTPGRKFRYVGYATAAGTGSPIADPGNLYKTIWTILTNAQPSPLGGTATLLQDSTTGSFVPTGFYAVRNLLIRKSTAGDYDFMQTIGPFKRAFGIPTGTSAADTLKWIAVARPSVGLNVQWTAFDSTFVGTAGTLVRLQIFGKIETVESINDSSAAHSSHLVYRSRTWRKITVGGSVVQDDATTSRLWLERNVGPVQIRIVEDTENIGHFRVMQSKNF